MTDLDRKLDFFIVLLTILLLWNHDFVLQYRHLTPLLYYKPSYHLELRISVREE